MTNIPVKFRVQRINEAIEYLKDDFVSYIKDKEYPLEERWDTFCKAPSELSVREPYINTYSDFKSVNAESDLRDWLEISGRGCVVYAIDIVEEKLENEEEVDSLKEEFLKHNLKSFELDW